ncbi:hypothetical protein ACGF0J_31855 [Nonomuraea sp. NPDC047897]|uniref:hypothetical protein n=1 Tax=Nonomuraea sp. NPDC047897 TaxID=3364346 RepID=UPI003714C4F9
MSVVLLALMSAIAPSVPTVPASAERWHAWPPTKHFPASVPGTSPSGARVTYLLAGIAREASCRRVFRPAALRMLRGCVTALRATYTDSTQTYVITAGITVLARPGSARATAGIPPGATVEVRAKRLRSLVRPLAVAGGPAERFGRRQCLTGFALASGDGRVVASAAGYADGRPYRRGAQVAPRLVDGARQLAQALHRNLTR